jgi:hypothetical protein
MQDAVCENFPVRTYENHFTLANYNAAIHSQVTPLSLASLQRCYGAAERYDERLLLPISGSSHLMQLL